MKKIIFSDNTDLEISNISETGNGLKIEIDSIDANSVIQKFYNNSAATGVMRYYVGIDLLRGYSGYTEMASLQYVPHVATSVDYETTDDTTESGFAETYADKITVTMQKPATPIHGVGADEIAEIKEDIQKINNALEGM
ncbi:MAG TPA: hypothetical protein H9955_02900 [Candidatus Mediterraneibacter cottocaccae]|nr:hypothetical protein [Candidatus Mediterraneibacter cottocaccae]